MKILLAISLLLTLAACSTVPEPIRSEPPTSPGLAEVRSQPERFLGQPVRWGGSIVRVTNTPEESQIEVVSRPLHRDGEPRQVDHSDGRFIAIVPGFIDPAIYAAGRRITVTGTLGESIEQTLGEMHYRYPMVVTEAYYLWPEWRGDPYYDPWPWYPYGYPYGPYRDPFYYPYWRPYPW